MAAPRVFISMGTPYSSESQAFRDTLEAVLRDQCGVDPRIIGKNEYPDGNPLSKIKSVMSQCDGVVVVAYERKFLADGTEKRASSVPVPLQSQIYTTPWNHIESAMAYSLGIPLYILCQRGLSEEGLIETKVDWYVQYVDLDPAELHKADVLSSMRNWVTTRVIPRKKTPKLLKSLDGRTKFSEMTPREIWSIIGVLAAVFGLGVGAANLLPGLFG
ncbi:hypothetical protein [Erythrobacter litoralis]|uniref:TIR domain-containing protein n=1 Tax=Erythrobacter litoralis (strain HTCC2594) TaxID=314225 RepID=Q2NBT2_ERYLH|nr:hypothetical protein [Erythrobacter litoralis]ABC62859.1 hypothetical protein ELI_03835 [Erythrobacter litoralis HTCC2594]